MLETILLAFLLGKARHYKIKYLFFVLSVYPVLLVQCVLIFLQINAFFGHYYLIQYASILQMAVILSFIFPIISLGLYKPALIGSGSIMIGTILNHVVINSNGGKMPVFPSFSYVTGYVKSDTFSNINDLHILGNTTTHLKFLTDFIDLGYSILSPGDVFIHFFSFIMLYYMIKAVNLKFSDVQ